MRGATDSVSGINGFATISIHAPRAGRDLLKLTLLRGDWIFQSTRPVRGATLLVIMTLLLCSLFQSTRPVRGATRAVPGDVTLLKISIHAPRAGRDFSILILKAMSLNFNPRAPCGARL